NEVTVASDAIDSNPDNNKAKITTKLLTLADISVTGSVSSTSPSAGDTIQYTLTAVNLGPSAFDNPKVVATFPKGFVPTAVDIGAMDCVISGPDADDVYTVTCANKTATPVRDSFQPGITAAGVVTVEIPDDATPGEYVASAVTYSRSPEQCDDPTNPPQDTTVGTCEPNYANNSASVAVTVVDRADTQLTKTLVGPNPLVAGVPAVYELTAYNAGPSVAHDVTVADKIPDDMTFVSGQVLPNGALCVTPDDPEEENVVRCTVGTMAPETSVKIRLTFEPSLHYRGELCNTALVGSGALDPAVANNEAKDCADTVGPDGTDLEPIATPDKPYILAGDAAGYTVVVKNNGPYPTTGAKVQITVPPLLGHPVVVVSGQTGRVKPGSCQAQGNVYTCDIGDIWPEDTVTYRITGDTTEVHQDEVFVLDAEVSHDLPPDLKPENDKSSAQITVTDHADLSLVKTIINPPVATELVAGGNVVYRLTVTNAGPSLAEDVTIEDTIPDGTTFVAGPANCAVESQDGTSVVKCQVGDLPSDGTATVDLTFSTDLEFWTEICNTGSANSSITPDPDESNNGAQVCVTPSIPQTDVGVEVTADKPEIVTGDPVGYTVVVKNNGPVRTTGTKLTITVPPHVKDPQVRVSGSTGSVSPGACTAAAGVFTCDIGDFAVGDTVTYRVTGTAQATTHEDLTLRAHVSHDNSDSNPDNDDAQAVVVVDVGGGGGGSTKPPTPKPSPSGKLPFTGANTALPTGLAVNFLLTGAALVAQRARRRDH
ncbi:MAG: DUF11 domain-containing protein, partial [Bifidobacteriaceae bacterium]|nr:DUF11 domain-containing protein [Bifidobacteriaceae bacterium]